MNRVVITGIGAITPVGNTAGETWESLISGVHGIDFITRFDASDFKVRIAAEVKDFDPLSHFTKDEARKMDIYAQYALVAASEAVADSGIAEKVEAERFGVYFGSGIGGMTTFMTEHAKLLAGGPRKVSPFYVPMMISNIAAGNIAIRFGCKGPTLPIVTACATSTNSIGEAFRAVKHGYADAIIAGGSEATINPLAVAGFINCMALSAANDPDASSLPFDKRRAGFVMGEGAGALIIEEYEHAVSRGAHIYAEIIGYGNTCDAYHMTAPSPEAEGATMAFSLAMRESGWEPGTRVHINSHGTGTLLNDKAETLALKKAFGESEAAVLKITGTKSMTGHMLGAAGAVEAIASAMALQTGIIPPTVGLLEPDPECDLDYTPGKAVNAVCEMAFSSSLGFGGHNAVVAMRRYERN